MYSKDGFILNNTFGKAGLWEEVYIYYPATRVSEFQYYKLRNVYDSFEDGKEDIKKHGLKNFDSYGKEYVLYERNGYLSGKYKSRQGEIDHPMMGHDEIYNLSLSEVNLTGTEFEQIINDSLKLSGLPGLEESEQNQYDTTRQLKICDGSVCLEIKFIAQDKLMAEIMSYSSGLDLYSLEDLPKVALFFRTFLKHPLLNLKTTKSLEKEIEKFDTVYRKARYILDNRRELTVDTENGKINREKALYDDKRRSFSFLMALWQSPDESIFSETNFSNIGCCFESDFFDGYPEIQIPEL